MVSENSHDAQSVRNEHAREPRQEVLPLGSHVVLDFHPVADLALAAEHLA